MLLPTNPEMLQGFKTIAQKDCSDKMSWAELLDPHGPHKLMYSLQIVESLSRPPKNRKRSMVGAIICTHIHKLGFLYVKNKVVLAGNVNCTRNVH